MYDFKSMMIGLASPEEIIAQSYGEVLRPETINYRTQKPEKGGLFCERIFGPQKNYECHCGKYKRMRYKGTVCDRCGVEVTVSAVRRERMGHITLAVPVSHILYLKGIPCKIASLLNISPRSLEKVVYFTAYVVVDPGNSTFAHRQILSEKEYRDAKEEPGVEFVAKMGAEGILEVLEQLDLQKIADELRLEAKTAKIQKKLKLVKRLEVVDAFLASNNKPQWMMLSVLPVMPPELRPMVQLDGGRFATSDLNDLYRRVINRNNRLKRLLALGAPEIIVKNEKRMLQEAVDALIDNTKRDKPVLGTGNRPLKSLADMLKGKHGRFRQNLLGKRVDYSGRSVIVVGPELKMHQCGLPKEMAIELFKPFVIQKLVSGGIAHNIKSAKKMIEKTRDEVWAVLEEIISQHPVLLNRAPTLHRLGIQAFDPLLVEGRAVKLHPLVCSAFNADFDGDQMAVHVPLSPEAQAEARILMMPVSNLLKPQDGKSVATPTKDIVLGCYYLTMLVEDEKGAGMAFASPAEAMIAFENKIVGLHAPIKIKITKEINKELKSQIVNSTIGRLIFNEKIPQDLEFVNRAIPGNEFELEINFEVEIKTLGKLIDRSIRLHGMPKTAELLDHIKEQGFKFATKCGTTVGITDIVIPKEKHLLIKEADSEIDKINQYYNDGFLTAKEMQLHTISVWAEVTSKVKTFAFSALSKLNPIKTMIDSGARGSQSQVNQLGGMRGLMSDATGESIDIPIKSNFSEGLNVFEFFISAHGARKGLTDVALRTSDSGYLTRRLVDVSQDIIITEYDCGTKEGIEISDIKDGNEIIETMFERLIGRYPNGDIMNPKSGEIIAFENKLISDKIAISIIESGILKVPVRSVLKCKCRHGVCAKCYGQNLATAETADVGEAVGIVAAQSIGEPGTQLTLRNFHTGGIMENDITQGLPRVEELFEIRRPKGQAIISEIDGIINIVSDTKFNVVVVRNPQTDQSLEYTIPHGSRIRVQNGSEIKKGDKITEGSIDPRDLLRIKGSTAASDYLVSEVQKVYKLQGVDINDKHIEVIIRQMMRKVKIESRGKTSLTIGTLVDIDEVEFQNSKLENEDKAQYSEVIMGITKSSLATESFLSAASFQETTKVLTGAAIKGKVDPLLGLKENVIIGKLIPAGTGLSVYNQVEVYPEHSELKKVERTTTYLYGNVEDF